MYYWVRKTCLDFFSISSYNRYYDSFISISTTIAKTLKSIILSKMTSFVWTPPSFYSYSEYQSKARSVKFLCVGSFEPTTHLPATLTFCLSISQYFWLFRPVRFSSIVFFFRRLKLSSFLFAKTRPFFTDLDNWKMNSRGRGKFSMSIHFFFFNFTLYFSYSIACLRVIFSVNFLETCLESVLEFSRICHFFRLEWIYSPAYSKHPKILLII